MFEIVRVISILMQPYCPTLAKSILDFLRVDLNKRSLQDCYINLQETKSIEFDMESKKKLFVNKVEITADN